MLPNLPSLPPAATPSRGSGDPGRRLQQKGREIKNAVPPAAEADPSAAATPPGRGGFGLGGEAGRRGDKAASPVIASLRLGSGQGTTRAAWSRGEPLLHPWVGGRGWPWSDPAAGGDSRLGAGGQGRGEVFLAVATSQRVFAKPGEPRHAGKRLPSPQLARAAAGRCSRAVGEAGRGCWERGPAPPPRQALVINNPGGERKSGGRLGRVILTR